MQVRLVSGRLGRQFPEFVFFVLSRRPAAPAPRTDPLPVAATGSCTFFFPPPASPASLQFRAEAEAKAKGQQAGKAETRPANDTGWTKHLAPHPEDSDEELEYFFNERTQESTYKEPPEYSRWLRSVAEWERR